ncbi:ribonuclease E inhibitor RraB [Ruegeria arenilitoris]|uniref:ribonuclease E inhibitor RraB n=1 Tax=Ruegeria arenilitoris TaxID=1173585 RepID=UPI001C2B8CA3|nr:ribonuclease E inhibitor RraB [Ruegeria arenilitoris]
MSVKSFIQDALNTVEDLFLKPSNEEMLKSAAEHGADLSEPAPFTFDLAFKHRLDADVVAKELAEKGYNVTQETDDEGDPYPHEIEAEVTIIPDVVEIKKHEGGFKSIAAQYSARYDDYSIGFGTDLDFFDDES